MNIQELNDTLSGKEPQEIIRWALDLNKKTILTTNFGPYEAAILHAVVGQAPDIPVVWCDTGYNTPQTYRHAQELIDQLKLQVDLYVPKQSTAYRDVVMGIPAIDTPAHDLFTYQVKLEPFERAMKYHQPEVWFTNLRKGQTEFRSGLDVVSLTNEGVLKVCPFFHFSDQQLDEYLSEHGLPNEDRYFDPTKALSNRECGLHTSL